MDGNTRLTFPLRLSGDQTVELPSKVLAPFVQSSLTVRRSSSSANELHIEESETSLRKRHLDSIIQDPVNNTNLDKVFLLDPSPRKYLGNDDQDVDQHLGLQKSLTVSRHPDGVNQNGGKAQRRNVLPKPSELFSRSRKGTLKPVHTKPKSAVCVEEHVKQLQRKKANFYGGKQETIEPFIPQESHVHVTREQLQRVPTLDDVTKPRPPSPSFWPSDNWLNVPHIESASTSHEDLQNNFQATSVTMNNSKFPINFPMTSAKSIEHSHLHLPDNEDNQYTFWGVNLLCRETYSEE